MRQVTVHLVTRWTEKVGGRRFGILFGFKGDGEREEDWEGRFLNLN